MNNRALSARNQTIGPVRVEVALQGILRRERTLVAVADAEIEGQIPAELPVVLEVEAVDARARQPGSQLRVKIRLANGSEQEAGERVACIVGGLAIRLKPGRHAVEVECSARPVRDRRVKPEVQQFVAHFEGVRAVNLRQIITKR